MNTREQLSDLRAEIIDYVELTDGNKFNDSHIKLCDKLLEERPYEPGERIEVKVREENDWQNARFLCMYPCNDEYIVYYKNCLGAITYCHCRFHRRPPKTYRVKPVPEEIMEAAKTHAEYNETAADEVCDWLANPENWEADNE